MLLCIKQPEYDGRCYVVGYIGHDLEFSERLKGKTQRISMDDLNIAVGYEITFEPLI